MNNKSTKYIYFLITSGVVNLIILFYFKYSYNQLSFDDFTIFNTGNLINLFITMILLSGCIVLLILPEKKSRNPFNLKILNVLSIIYLFPLIVIVIFKALELPFANEYLLGYPFKKILPAIFFLFNQIVFLYVSFLVWFMVFNKSYTSYLYSFLLILISSTLLIVLTLFYSFWIVEYNQSIEKKQYDYGIILGAAVWKGNIPSPIFIGRINKGAELFEKKAIKKIHLTGGNAPGELSEAKTAFNFLRSNFNLDSNHILIEEITSTTNEQIRYIKNNLVKKQKKTNFIFISDEFHLMRIKEMSKFYGLDATVVSSEYELNFQKSLYYRLRDSIGLILFWLFAI